MNLERPWLQSYPAGVPAEIDVEEFRSVAAVFNAGVHYRLAGSVGIGSNVPTARYHGD